MNRKTSKVLRLPIFLAFGRAKRLCQQFNSRISNFTFEEKKHEFYQIMFFSYVKNFAVFTQAFLTLFWIMSENRDPKFGYLVLKAEVSYT